MNKDQEFLHKLKNLLSEYNATISANVGEASDTHGIYDENITISLREGKTFKYNDILKVDGWTINSEDIK